MKYIVSDNGPEIVSDDPDFEIIPADKFAEILAAFGIDRSKVLCAIKDNRKIPFGEEFENEIFDGESSFHPNDVRMIVKDDERLLCGRANHFVCIRGWFECWNDMPVPDGLPDGCMYVYKDPPNACFFQDSFLVLYNHKGHTVIDVYMIVLNGTGIP